MASRLLPGGRAERGAAAARREAEHAAQLAEEWLQYAEETALERDESEAWGRRMLEDTKYLDDCFLDLTRQLQACRQQAQADGLAAQAEASRLRSDVAGLQWMLKAAGIRMGDLQECVDLQQRQLQATQLELAPYVLCMLEPVSEKKKALQIRRA
eukprot:SM000127S26671  [mRNA]  locus=s127:346975:347771:- [translate_table: standard]